MMMMMMMTTTMMTMMTMMTTMTMMMTMRWAGHEARMGDRRGVLRDLVGKREGKRPLGRPRPRWEDNIKMDL